MVGLEEILVCDRGLLWKLLGLRSGEELRRGIEALPRGAGLCIEAGGVRVCG
jgi:hypothetical protein